MKFAQVNKKRKNLKENFSFLQHFKSLKKLSHKSDVCCMIKKNELDE